MGHKHLECHMVFWRKDQSLQVMKWRRPGWYMLPYACDLHGMSINTKELFNDRMDVYSGRVDERIRFTMKY